MHQIVSAFSCSLQLTNSSPLLELNLNFSKKKKKETDFNRPLRFFSVYRFLLAAHGQAWYICLRHYIEFEDIESLIRIIPVAYLCAAKD